MRSSEFVNLLHECHASLVKLTGSKGEEYRVGDDDQFANFKRQSKYLQLPMEKVLLVYLSKHLDSITNYVNTCPVDSDREWLGSGLSEPIEGRIDDAILYLVLLRGMVRERQQERPFDAEGYNHSVPIVEPAPRPQRGAGR